MVAQPASIPAARRFVDDALAEWSSADLADDIGLCASELATNATLHSGSSFFEIRLDIADDGIRLTVADHGVGSVEMIARQPELSDAFGLAVGDASSTGRGMLLVSTLATRWGIDQLEAGKRVWAEFRPGSAGLDADPSAPLVTRAPVSGCTAPDPAKWAVVRFRGCPPGLLVAHDDNLAEYTRELKLLGDRLHEPSYQRLGEVLADYVAEHAANWDPARIIAREAVREGREAIDFDVLATRRIRESLLLLRKLIWEAESLSWADRLMTLPAAEPVQRLRDWMECEFIGQIEDGLAPLPYADWLAGVRR
ncbi:MAG TPA: ATP-binding protein [Marmoricola sp.]